MSRNGIKRSRTSQIPIFVTKLYEMIDDRSNAQIISWTSTGDSFSIHNISRFTEQILPIYFKHRNFASFIRQLNMYGFRKIRHSDGDNVYMNENFKLGARHLLKNISRKIKEEKQEQVEVYGRNRSNEEPSVNRQIQELKTNQKNLQQLCRHFISQNQRLLEENQTIVRRMEEEQRQKERKLQELLVFLLTQKESRALKNGAEGMPPLQLTNSAHTPETNGSRQSGAQTPLEMIGNAMEENDQLSRARQLIQGIYNRKKGRKENNHTYVQPQADQPLSNYMKSPAPDMGLPQIVEEGGMTPKRMQPMNLQEEDKSFMSINDFLNVEDGYQNHFDLDSSV